MNPIVPLMPGQPVPDLEVALAGGGTWRLSNQTPKNFTFIVVYRGLHCPICKKYLLQIQDERSAFAERGVGILALSSDDHARAERSVADWGLGALDVGYGMTLDEARRWGLYISHGRPKTDPNKVGEPAMFVEPGHFLIRPDRTLFFGSVQTMPFTRPAVAELLKGIDYVLENHYPPRGTVVDHTKAA
ncbi:MAG: redoxin domain-containing protein [Alphaproteobacteria bacterium]|nr:redoxin domain-containing protein [Alphaproteobacteria bacterium]